jgi:hypothetical protein
MHKRYSGFIFPLLKEFTRFIRIDTILNLECYHRGKNSSFITIADSLSL